jgi:hypothetical protein
MLRPLEITQLGIEAKAYFYAIYCRNRLVKYGISYNDNEIYWLCRLYRQIGHLASFGKYRLEGDNDIRFRDTERQFEQQYGMELDHNDVTVELELFDHYLFETAKPRTELENYESLKIQTYVERYGFLPPGNTKILNHNRAAVNQATFKKLFEYD